MKRAESPPRLDVPPNATCVSSFFSTVPGSMPHELVTCHAEFGRTIALEPVPSNRNRNRFHSSADFNDPESQHVLRAATYASAADWDVKQRVSTSPSYSAS